MTCSYRSVRHGGGRVDPLAKQGIRGLRPHSRGAAAPSSSPANTRTDSSEQRFFDKLREGALRPLFCGRRD